MCSTDVNLVPHFPGFHCQWIYREGYGTYRLFMEINGHMVNGTLLIIIIKFQFYWLLNSVHYIGIREVSHIDRFDLVKTAPLHRHCFSDNKSRPLNSLLTAPSGHVKQELMCLMNDSPCWPLKPLPLCWCVCPSLYTLDITHWFLSRFIHVRVCSFPSPMWNDSPSLSICLSTSFPLFHFFERQILWNL